MVDLLDEIRADIKEERLLNLIRKYGVHLVIAGILIVVATFGVNRFNSALVAKQQLSGDAFQSAVVQIGTDNTQKALEELSALQTEGTEQFVELALLRKAGLLAGEGRTDEALATYDTLVEKSGAEPALKGLALISASYLRLDKDPASVDKASLKRAAEEGRPWRYFALELEGLLALQQNQLDQAEQIFSSLTLESVVPQALRLRAVKMVEIIKEMKYS